MVITKIYPASDLYPADDLYPNNGERVTRGFAIDFATGQIYGGISQPSGAIITQDVVTGDLSIS